ncbi:MAG: DUF1351 domain-containing protein [Clostridium sp.]|nr:DUF1351 domain-containing protein [Clostridium sp.]
MELRIEPVTMPEVIEFNFEELKEQVTKKVVMYKNLVYTDDQVKEAKADRAALNKFVKSLSDERIRVKKQCLKPYEEFESKINELTAIVNEPIQLIDKQVKEYEEKQKTEKLEGIKNLFATIGFQNFVTLEKIFDQKWLNAGTSMKKIEDSMSEKKFQIGNDVLTINSLPEFSFEAMEEYKRTLDLSRAIQEGQRLADIAKRKAEHEAELKRQSAEREAAKAETPTEIPEAPQLVEKVESVVTKQDKKWISFAALLSTEDALALKAFFTSRNIEFKAI